MKPLVVMPATNVSSKHSFSALRRINTYLHHYAPKCLNNLTLLQVIAEKKMRWICPRLAGSLLPAETEEDYGHGRVPP